MTERILQLNSEKRIFWGLLGALLLSACFYIYFINSTVHNVVLRQNLESELSQLSLSIGSQEFEYIAKKSSVTLETAYALGFKDTENKSYLARNPDTKVAFAAN